MKKTRYFIHLAGLMLMMTIMLGLNGCGTTHAHIGLEHDIDYNWNNGHFEDGGYHHHKPKHKVKKPKHNSKHHNPGKHKHHHHD